MRRKISRVCVVTLIAHQAGSGDQLSARITTLCVTNAGCRCGAAGLHPDHFLWKPPSCSLSRIVDVSNGHSLHARLNLATCQQQPQQHKVTNMGRTSSSTVGLHAHFLWKPELFAAKWLCVFVMVTLHARQAGSEQLCQQQTQQH